MMLMDLSKKNKPKTFVLYMLCLSLRQYYLDQVHWVPHLREISGVKATPRRFDFAIKSELYVDIDDIARCCS